MLYQRAKLLLPLSCRKQLKSRSWLRGGPTRLAAAAALHRQRAAQGRAGCGRHRAAKAEEQRRGRAAASRPRRVARWRICLGAVGGGPAEARATVAQPRRGRVSRVGGLAEGRGVSVGGRGSPLAGARSRLRPACRRVGVGSGVTGTGLRLRCVSSRLGVMGYCLPYGFGWMGSWVADCCIILTWATNLHWANSVLFRNFGLPRPSTENTSVNSEPENLVPNRNRIIRFRYFSVRFSVFRFRFGFRYFVPRVTWGRHPHVYLDKYYFSFLVLFTSIRK